VPVRHTWFPGEAQASPPAKLGGKAERPELRVQTAERGAGKRHLNSTLSRQFPAPRPSEMAWWDHGFSGRVRFWCVWGLGGSVAGVLPAQPPSALPADLPHRWGDRLGKPLGSIVIVWGEASYESISTLWGRCPAGQRGMPHGTPSARQNCTGRARAFARNDTSRQAPQDAGVNRATRACLSPG
jgi:hypothetical protein